MVPLRLEDMKVPDFRLWGANREQILPSAFRTWNWKLGFGSADWGSAWPARGPWALCKSLP